MLLPSPCSCRLLPAPASSLCCPVLLRVVFAVRAVARARDPLGVLLVPADRLLQPALPGLKGPPAQLPLDLRRVDGVAAVVAGAVFDELNQRGRLAQSVQDRLGDLDVAPLVARADVVGLAGATPPHHREDGAAVVFDV